MRNENEIRAEMNLLTKQHADAIYQSRIALDTKTKALHLESALLLRGKILGLTWVLRNVGRSKVYK